MKSGNNNDNLREILAAARTIAEMPVAEVPINAARSNTASTVAEAHFRAECEGVPVTVGSVTIYPIGLRPMP